MTDPNDVIARMEWQIEEKLAQAEALKREMAVLQATAQSRDGSVEVTVNNSGGLAGLYLGRDAMRRTGDELADLILDVSRRAQVQLAEKMSRTVGDLLGPGSDTAAFIGQAYADQFPAPDTDDDRPAGGRR